MAMGKGRIPAGEVLKRLTVNMGAEEAKRLIMERARSGLLTAQAATLSIDGTDRKHNVTNDVTLKDSFWAGYEVDNFITANWSTGDFRTLIENVNWRAFNKGQFRGALSFGLTDGAPDAQLIVGYVATF